VYVSYSLLHEHTVTVSLDNKFTVCDAYYVLIDYLLGSQQVSNYQTFQY